MTRARPSALIRVMAGTLDIDRPYFFDDGLCFECTQCGQCCTGRPGSIYVAAAEIEVIARHLGITPAALVADTLYPFRDSYSIREGPNGDCVFFRGAAGGCAIYPVRPRQCRTYPFWPALLAAPERWAGEASRCPGIGQGRVYSRGEIMALLEQQL